MGESKSLWISSEGRRRKRRKTRRAAGRQTPLSSQSQMVPEAQVRADPQATTAQGVSDGGETRARRTQRDELRATVEKVIMELLVRHAQEHLDRGAYTSLLPRRPRGKRASAGAILDWVKLCGLESFARRETRWRADTWQFTPRCLKAAGVLRASWRCTSTRSLCSRLQWLRCFRLKNTRDTRVWFSAVRATRR